MRGPTGGRAQSNSVSVVLTDIPWPISSSSTDAGRAQLAEPWYDAQHAFRRVRAVFISETRAGEPVGIAETRHGEWLVRYANIDLGLIDPRRNHLIRYVPPQSDRKSANKPKRLLPMYPI